MLKKLWIWLTKFKMHCNKKTIFLKPLFKQKAILIAAKN